VFRGPSPNAAARRLWRKINRDLGRPSSHKLSEDREKPGPREKGGLRRKTEVDAFSYQGAAKGRRGVKDHIRNPEGSQQKKEEGDKFPKGGISSAEAEPKQVD